jgi:hypothetical protein
MLERNQRGKESNFGRKSDFVKLLSSKLSDVLDTKQKENKVRNILNNMRQDGIIERAGGNRRIGYWVLTIDYRNPAK